MARIEVVSEVTGKVWKIQIPLGNSVVEEDIIMIIESMKMEIPVFSTHTGNVAEILVQEGDPVEEGQIVAIVET